MSELLPLNLQFFAQDGPGGEKTEEATPKRLSDARKRGQVAKSKELTSSMELVSMFLAIKIFVGFVGERFINVFKWIYANLIPDVIALNRDGLTVQANAAIFLQVVLQMVIIIIPFMIIGFAISFIADLVQVRWQVSAEPLQPKLDKLNPLNGFKRIFSFRALFELAKSILKIVLIAVVAYLSVRSHVEELFILYEISLNQAVALVGDIIINTGLEISIVYIIVGVGDYLYQRYKFKEDMKMTKQEIKDEYKDAEGDPQVKAKQKQRMQEASQRRMMKNVPSADVVITNPTHIAVAIKYEAEANRAPIVVAKGEEYLAKRIRDEAKEANVPIVENKPLARALYATVDIDQEIPPELYEAVAEILAMIYNSRNR